MRLGPPETLTSSHRVESFDCGEAILNEWLRKRALGNQISGASRTFVVTDEARRVMGYYALAAGAVTHEAATGAVKRNMPDPIPVLVLGRLAVDREAQGLKLGGTPPRRRKAHLGRVTGCWNQGASGACADRTGQTVLRAVRVSVVAAASDDLDAAAANFVT